MQTIITGKKVKHSFDTLDSKRVSDILVHKRVCGQVYIRLMSEHRTSVCCQNFLLCKVLLVCFSLGSTIKISDKCSLLIKKFIWLLEGENILRCKAGLACHIWCPPGIQGYEMELRYAHPGLNPLMLTAAKTSLTILMISSRLKQNWQII